MVDDDGQLRLGRPNTPLPKPGEPMWKEQSAGARIVLRMSRLASPADAQRVMAPEMAHAVSPHLTRGAPTDSERPSADQAVWVLEGYARWVEHFSEPGSAARGVAFVRRKKARYKPASGASLPGNPRFYSADGARTTFKYELSAAVFTAAERLAGRQKAVDLYITLSNQMQLMTDTGKFLDPTLIQLGIDPAQFWRLVP